MTNPRASMAGQVLHFVPNRAIADFRREILS
jgi:hypothetical protein